MKENKSKQLYSICIIVDNNMKELVSLSLNKEQKKAISKLLKPNYAILDSEKIVL